MFFSRKLVVPMLAALLLLVSGYVISLAYQRTAEASLYLSDQILEGIGEAVISQTDRLFSTAEAQLELNLLLVESGSKGQQGLLQTQEAWLHLLWKQLQLNENLDSIYLADTKGGFLMARRTPRPATIVSVREGGKTKEAVVYRETNFQPIAHVAKKSDYDPRTRPWYQRAVESKGSEPVWSDVYRFATAAKTGISASIPFRNEAGQLMGVLAADITMDGLVDFMTKQAFGDFDLASIINAKDELVAYPMRLNLVDHPTSQDSLLPTLTHVSEEHAWVKTAWEAHHTNQKEHDLHAESRATLNFTHEGEEYISVLFSMPDRFPLDWKLLMVAPEEELLGHVNRSISENLLITLMVIIFAGLMLYMMVARFGGRRQPEEVL